MLNNNSKNKLKELAHVLIFTVLLFALMLMYADWKDILVNESGVRWRGLSQAVIYLGIMDLGIILCLTNIVFSKVEAFLRLSVFLSILYGSSLLYFSRTPLNPLGSIIIFSVYTIMFCMTAGAVLACWYTYQSSVSKRYAKALNSYNQKMPL